MNLDKVTTEQGSICTNGVYIFFYGELRKKLLGMIYSFVAILDSRTAQNRPRVVFERVQC